MRIAVASTLKWAVTVVAALFLLSVLIAYAILVSYDYNSLKPEIQRVAADAMGKEVTLGGDITLKIGLTPTLVVRDVRVKNAPWGSEPELAKIKRFEIRVRLTPLLARKIDIVRLVLIEPEVLLERDAAGRSNLAVDEGARKKTAGGGAGTGGWDISRITFDELRVEKGRVIYLDHGSGKRYAVDVTVFTASAGGIFEGPVRIEARGIYNGEAFDITGTVGSLAAFVKPSLAWRIDIAIRTGGAVLVLDGSLDDPRGGRGMRLDLSLKADDPARLSRLAGLSTVLAGPLDVSGRISDAGVGSYSISDLRVVQGENSFGGFVRLDASGERLAVKAVLSARRLDMRPHIKTEKDADKPSKKRGRIFPREPLPLEFLDRADVDMKLRAKEVLLPDITLSDLDVSFVLKDGALDVSSLKTGVGEGSMEGGLSLKPQGKTALLSSSVKLSKVDVRYLAGMVSAAKSVEGNLDADINVKARGTSIAALMKSMTGKAVFLMGKGRIYNRHIDLLGAGFSTGLFRLLNPFEKDQEYTTVNCFVGAFNIKNGLARATTLVLNTQYMVVVGSGTINLGTERLNLSLKPVPKEGISAGPLGKLGISAGELTRPFRLRGTLADPRLTIDPALTAIILGRTIGSVTLFGPAGIAAALVGKASDEETSCAAAIAAARKGVRFEKRKGLPGKVEEGAADVLEDIGDKLKDLFGK